MKQQVRVMESQSAAGEDNVLHHSSFDTETEHRVTHQGATITQLTA